MSAAAAAGWRSQPVASVCWDTSIEWLPALPEMLRRYAPPAEGGADVITAPRSWHFSNRSDQLDEARQEELGRDAAKKKGME